jgi:ATP-dependent Lhr-like helicase
VVFWDLLGHEELSVPWRQLLWALRRLEARGLVRGGRFVTGFVGEQFALPEAVDHLRRLRRSPRCGEVIHLNAADPLNLTGIILPGRRVPAVRTNRVVYHDGLLEPTEESVGS